jgi:hypothetical protein
VRCASPNVRHNSVGYAGAGLLVAAEKRGLGGDVTCLSLDTETGLKNPGAGGWGVGFGSRRKASS